jgi:hypothetical protein
MSTIMFNVRSYLNVCGLLRLLVDDPCAFALNGWHVKCCCSILLILCVSVVVRVLVRVRLRVRLRVLVRLNWIVTPEFA